MTLNQYQEAAQRTSSTTTSQDKILNGLLGIFGEGGECSDIYKKYLYQGHPPEKEHMKKELGDVMWYVAELATGLGMTLDEIAQMNIDKLQVRYPVKFDPQKSMHRADGDV